MDGFFSEVDITRDRLNKDIKKKKKKKKNEKDLINLIEANHHINMTSDHYVSRNNSF